MPGGEPPVNLYPRGPKTNRMHCENPLRVFPAGNLYHSLQPSSNRFAMRNRFSTLAVSLIALLALFVSQDLVAQCTPSFITSDVTVELDNTSGDAQISTAELVGAINKSGPDCGDFVFYLAVPSDGQAGTAEPYPVDCSDVGTLVLWAILDDSSDGDDNVYDVGTDYGPWQLNIAIQDNTDPTIVCPANQVVNADADCEGSIGINFTFDPDPFAGAPATYTDNCSASPSYSITNGAVPANGVGGDLTGVDFQLGVSTVTMTATDPSGNTDQCSFTVTVNDVTDPTWVPETNTIADWYTTIGVSLASSAITSVTYGAPGFNRLTVTLNCDDPDYNTVRDWFLNTYVPTAEDNCDPDPTEIFFDQFDVNTPWTCPTVEHIRRRWRAQDAEGNDIDPVPPGSTVPLAKLDLITQNTVAPVYTVAPADLTIQANNPAVLRD